MIRGRAAEGAGDAKSAAEFYERAARRFPFFAPAERSLALIYYNQLHNDEKALAFAMKARSANGADHEINKIAAILSYRRGDYAQCVQILNADSAATKSDGEALCYLGLAQYQLKNNTQSKTTLQQAVLLELPRELADEAGKVLAQLK
jgi:tetratricopeptide (TPR) repeat protein